MTDRTVAETYTRQHTTITRDNQAPVGIRTRNPRTRATAELRHRDRLMSFFFPQSEEIFRLAEDLLAYHKYL